MTDTLTRRLTAAFQAIATQVRDEGWRLAKDHRGEVVTKPEADQWEAIFRRVCEDGSIDNFVYSYRGNVDDLDSVVTELVSILRGRCVDRAFSHYVFTEDDLERHKKRAYDRGAADERKASGARERKQWEDGLAEGRLRGAADARRAMEERVAADAERVREMLELEKPAGVQHVYIGDGMNSERWRRQRIERDLKAARCEHLQMLSYSKDGKERIECRDCGAAISREP